MESIISALANKESQISRIPWQRWNHDLVYHPDRARRGKTYADWAGLVDGDPNNFDPRPFNINKRESAQMDPQQKVLLELTHEAVGKTNYARRDLVGRNIGVFMGVSATDSGYLYGQDNLSGDSYFMTGTTQSLVSNRISHVFGWNGPNTPLDTACSSSLVALDAGLKSLQVDETEMVLVGGVSVFMNPMPFVGFSAANMLSSTGECHVFDQAADGYVRGEGAGVILLKPLDQAQKDGDQILATILSAGVSHNGENNLVSFPKRDAQAELIKTHMELASVGPEDFAYFEAHGTGTPVGDPIESYAIGTAAGVGRSSPIPIGSIKSNVGHLEPASGMAGLAKALAVGQSSQLLPQANFNNPSENIEFDEWNIRVVTDVEPTDFSKTPIVGVNSFGFGGVNCTVIMEFPVQEKSTIVPVSKATDTSARMVIDAFSEEALDGRVEQVDALAAENDPMAVSQMLLHQLDRGKYRAVRSVGPDQNWVRAEALSAEEGPVFVFAGNGAQRPGMGRAALNEDAAFKDAFARVAKILKPHLGFDPLEALLDEETEVDLDDTSISQPLLFALQAAYVDRLALDGLKPSAVIGHSVGEVAAAYACGGLSLEEACTVILARSTSQNATRDSGKMFAIIANPDSLDADDLAARFDAHIAGYNSGKVSSITVLGETTEFVDEMESRSIRCIDISISYPFHSPGMDSVREPLAELLKDLKGSTPKVDFYSTVTGEKWEGGDLTSDYWWSNVRQPVQFRNSVTAAIEAGHRHFLEISPFPIMVRHVRDLANDQNTEVAVSQIDNMPDKDSQTSRSISERIERFWAMGADLDMDAFAGCKPSGKTGLHLPSYPWDRERQGMDFSDDGPQWRVEQRPHPLLGDLRNPDRKYRNDIDHLRYPFLNDHQVQNRVLYPGAGTMELTLSAARLFQGLESDAPVRMKNFQLLRPLELSDEEWTSVQTRFDDASNQMVVEFRPGVQMGKFRQHAVAEILPGVAAAADNVEWPENDHAFPEILDHAALYRVTEALDLQYGPHFRCVESVRKVSETTIVADLTYPGDPMEGERETVHQLAYHPGLLDGAFQAALALLVDKAAGAAEDNAAELQTFVPQGVDEISFFGNEAAARKALITLRLVSEESVIADISLFDDAGVPVMTLERLRLMPMPSSGRPSINRETLQAPRWVPVAAASSNQPMVLQSDTPAVDNTLDVLAMGIACEGFKRLGQANGQESNSLSLSGSLEAGQIDEAQLPYVLALLSQLDDAGLAGTADGDVWSFSAKADEAQLRADWLSISKTSSEEVSKLSLLAHRLDHMKQTLDAERVVLKAEENTIAALNRGAGQEAAGEILGRSLIDWVQGKQNDAERRVCVRIIGGGASYLIASMMGSVRRSLPRHAIEWQIVEDDANLIARSQIDLAGVSGVEFVSLDELPTNPAADCVILMPALFGALEGQSDDTMLDPFVVNVEAECPIIGLQHLQSFANDFIFGADADYWSVDEESGLPIAKTHALGKLDDLLISAGLKLNGNVSGFGFDICCAQLSQVHEGYKAKVIHLLPNALPAALQGCCALDIRDLNFEPLADVLQGIAHSLANAQVEDLTQFVLISDDGNDAHAGLAAALSCVANENSWESYLHISIADSVAFDAQPLEDLISMHRGEGEIKLTSSGVLVRRYGPLVDMADGDAETPVFSRRLRGVLDPVSRKPALATALDADEILLESEASGLNFRDVMYAMRLLPAEALEDGFTGATIGMEAAGTVLAVGKDVSRFKPGDRAVAFASDAFSSHVKAKAAASVPLPNSISAGEAATLLTSYVTAWYGLVYCARVKSGDLVLVQAGAGALGLAAIQVAKHLGCTVAATAGSSLKQSVVRAAGADFVCYSRDGSFASVLEKKFGREAFSCVLNSVSGAAVEDGIRLLKPFGQFVEFGKRDFYENRPMFMKQLRRNITFHGVDTDQLLKYEPKLATEILTDLMDLLAKGNLAPILHQSASVSVLGSAMSDMQASHHIGKLVLTHPKMQDEPQGLPKTATHNCSIPTAGGIAVIGGAQGFGFEVVETLARGGAKFVFAITRSGKFAEEYAERAAALLNETGCTIEPLQADASDQEQLAKALDAIRAKAGSLTGIVQAAMILHDGVAATSTAEEWREVFQAKTAVCDAIDALTINDDLSLYLVFSSATTMIGNPGQANYVSANRVLEMRAEKRALAGKSGLAIGWGAIGNTGYLSRNAGVKSVLEKVIGQPALHAAQAMMLLRRLLSDADAPAIVHAMPANWSRLQSRLKTVQSRSFSTLVRYSPASGGDEDNFIEKLRLLPASEAHGALAGWLRDKLAEALRVDPQSLALNRALSDMGLDSLLAVEFASTLEAGLDLTMDVSQVNAEMTILGMADQLHGRLFGEETERSALSEPDAVETGQGEEADEVAGKMIRQHLSSKGETPAPPE